MHHAVKSLVSLSALALTVLISPIAHAQLISGSTHGVFELPAPANTTIVNGPVISTFASGIPYRFSDTKTSITFTGQTFLNKGDGDFLNLGLIKIKNGITLLGTTATAATMDLYLNIPTEGIMNFKLTTLLFGLDNTSNNGSQNIPDLFFIGYTDPATLHLDSGLMFFDIGFTVPSYNTEPGHPIAENKFGTTGIYAELAFVPVPEASTYALFAAVGLIGMTAFRRLRAVRGEHI